MYTKQNPKVLLVFVLFCFVVYAPGYTEGLYESIHSHHHLVVSHHVNRSMYPDPDNH